MDLVFVNSIRSDVITIKIILRRNGVFNIFDGDRQVVTRGKYWYGKSSENIGRLVVTDMINICTKERLDDIDISFEIVDDPIILTTKKKDDDLFNKKFYVSTKRYILDKPICNKSNFCCESDIQIMTYQEIVQNNIFLNDEHLYPWICLVKNLAEKSIIKLRDMLPAIDDYIESNNSNLHISLFYKDLDIVGYCLYEDGCIYEIKYYQDCTFEAIFAFWGKFIVVNQSSNEDITNILKSINPQFYELIDNYSGDKTEYINKYPLIGNRDISIVRLL